jgi:predicted protein tyrosine phosphatase
MFSSGTPLYEQFFNGTRFQFLVLSRAVVETFTAETPYLVISITDPEQPEANILDSPFLRATLRMKFHDIAKPNRIASQFATNSIDVHATEADAEQILSFVCEHLAEVKLIVCHCEQGISRSAAIAAALSHILQDEDEFFFQHYWVNRYVYELLLAKTDILKTKTRTINQ